MFVARKTAIGGSRAAAPKSLQIDNPTLKSILSSISNQLTIVRVNFTDSRAFPYATRVIHPHQRIAKANRIEHVARRFCLSCEKSLRLHRFQHKFPFFCLSSDVALRLPHKLEHYAHMKRPRRHQDSSSMHRLQATKTSEEFPMRKELLELEENSIKSILADAMMNESHLTDPAIDWEITKHNYDLCAPPPRGFKNGSFSWLFTHHLHGIGFIIVMWEISPFLVQIFLVIHQRSRANMGTHEDKSPALLIGFGSSDNVAIYFNFPSQKTYLFSSFSPRRKDLARGQ